MPPLNNSLFQTGALQEHLSLELLTEYLSELGNKPPLLCVNLGTDLPQILAQKGFSVQCWEDNYADHLSHLKQSLSSVHGINKNTEGKIALLHADKSTQTTLFFLHQVLQYSSVDTLLLCGENTIGIKGLQKKLEREWGPVQTVANGKKSRVLSLCRSNNFTPPQEIILEYSFNSPLKVISGAGTFGYGKVDKGSQLLLSQLPSLQGKTVLDWGCGNGVLSMAAVQLGAKAIYATDLSARALEITQSQAPQVKTYSSVQGHSTNLPSFDVVITNPPFHVGKKQELRIPELWAETCAQLLNSQGTLYLVANSFLPYQKELERRFQRAYKMSESHDFIVYMCEK